MSSWLTKTKTHTHAKKERSKNILSHMLMCMINFTACTLNDQPHIYTVHKAHVVLALLHISSKTGHMFLRLVSWQVRSNCIQYIRRTTVLSFRHSKACFCPKQSCIRSGSSRGCQCKFLVSGRHLLFQMSHDAAFWAIL